MLIPIISGELEAAGSTGMYHIPLIQKAHHPRVTIIERHFRLLNPMKLETGMCQRKPNCHRCFRHLTNRYLWTSYSHWLNPQVLKSWCSRVLQGQCGGLKYLFKMSRAQFRCRALSGDWEWWCPLKTGPIFMLFPVQRWISPDFRWYGWCP